MTVVDGVSSTSQAGARLESLLAVSPARDAGLAAGNVVLRVGEASVTSAVALITAVAQYGAGDRAVFEVEHGGQVRTVEVTFGDPGR